MTMRTNLLHKAIRYYANIPTDDLTLHVTYQVMFNKANIKEEEHATVPSSVVGVKSGITISNDNFLSC
jgi:hypothetical protein